MRDHVEAYTIAKQSLRATVMLQNLQSHEAKRPLAIGSVDSGPPCDRQYTQDSPFYEAE